MLGNSRTDRVVFDHAHRQCCPRPSKGVEVTSHGHGYEAHIDNARLGCRFCEIVLTCASRPWSCPESQPRRGADMKREETWIHTLLCHLDLAAGTGTGAGAVA